MYERVDHTREKVEARKRVRLTCTGIAAVAFRSVARRRPVRDSGCTADSPAPCIRPTAKRDGTMEGPTENALAWPAQPARARATKESCIL